MNAMRTSFAVCTTISLALLGGCSKKGLEKAIVTGSVTYLGEPVNEGSIRFVPTETKAGSMAGAMIVDGKYKASANGGVPIGRCRVEIKGRRAAPQSAQSGKPDLKLLAGPIVQYIPAKYNAESQLTVVIEAGEVQHNFDLK
jgi:hypothetical protein